jgi:uncharacterized peroxidase-related enzyme
MSIATQPPVIAPLTHDQAAGDVQAIFGRLTQAFGNIPAFFGTMARSPEALKHFMPLYAAVVNTGLVEAKYKELAYLKTALINGCEYCFRAHSASAKKKGVTEEQIKNLAFYQRSAAFDAREKATLLYAERVTRGASGIREGALQDLKKHYSDDQIVELTLAICIANFTNRFNDALMITPDIG